MNPGEIDDIVQETYFRLAQLDAIGHIREPRAYFFSIARNMVLESIRRTKVVRFQQMTEIISRTVGSDAPSPDRIVEGRERLLQVWTLVSKFPARRREIFRLRKIAGLSQREIAVRLGVSEHVVENELARGLKEMLRALAETPAVTESVADGIHERKTHQRAD